MGRCGHLLLAALAITSFTPGALAQTQAAQQGEDLAKSIRDGSSSEILSDGAEQNVPGYGGTDFDVSKYLEDEDGLTDAGVASRYTDPNYDVVIDSTRPEFDADTIDLTTAQTIENDPETYLGTDVSVGGSTGSCEPVPTSGTTSSTYYETCNEGAEIVDEARTCTAPLVVNVDGDEDKWRYNCHTRSTNNPSNANYMCSVLKSQAAFSSCTLVGSGIDPDWEICLQSGTWGCTEPDVMPTDIYECTEQLAFSGNWSKISSKQVASEAIDETMCSQTQGNDDCDLIEEVCVDADPETRDVDGLDVTRSCWEWQRTYQCQGRRANNDCSDLEARSECTYDHQECLSEDDDGSCNVYDNVYKCTSEDTSSGSSQAYVCAGDLYCIDGECTQVEREASTEFKDAMVAVQTLGTVRDEFDADTLTLFNGEVAKCHKPVFGLVNCCAGKSSGLITGAAGGAALASGPAAIAALATPFLTQFLCSSDEKTLDVKDRMGLCHYVGTYCSDKVLGVCTSKKKSYCCFESKLSRILQEQGREQLGMDWGTKKEPDCEGFLVEEFQQLDLSKMDFTEVYDEFVDAAKVPDEVETSIQIQEKIEEYYDLHDGG